MDMVTLYLVFGSGPGFVHCGIFYTFMKSGVMTVEIVLS